ncbi:hypothetical protein C483_07968 [Natrialba hulunbeirensis JCM 10989]|uniref:Uncharacterized protein n=2 Tax=Natrialba hulunbeirensis TaxID=123783 RepID=M0A0U9_9EURY|nr:hypothetical protein C483_07968 [Natrialba hulunbeirensis JCM 10989]
MCFNCQNEFQLNRERNWEVIYKVTDEEDDFFPRDFTNLLKYSEEGKKESTKFFQHELEKLRNMDNPQRRGKIFDHFVGLLFHQIDGLEVRIQPEGDSGETDVHIVCINGPSWFSTTCGTHTMIENKWEKHPIQKGPVHKFYGKISSNHSCERAYFLSMSGFSNGNRSNIGAHTVLKKFQDPEIVDLWEEDLQKMVDDGNPSRVLRQKLVP